MPRVILVKDKWDTYTIDATNLEAVALNLLTERYDEGWWYDEGELEWKDIVTAVENKDGDLAWRILERRADHEYEYVELQEAR